MNNTGPSAEQLLLKDQTDGLTDPKEIHMKRIIAAGLALVATAGLTSGAIAASTPPVTPDLEDPRQAATADIVDTAIAAGDFSTLVAAVQAAGLEATLRGDGPFTVFAPTDAAFAALPAGTLDSLLADPDALANILLYHVVAGEVLAADVVGLTTATAANGDAIEIEVVNGGVVLNGSANVVTTDVLATNGVIHVIDAVILPPEATTTTPPTTTPAPAETGNAGLVDGNSSSLWMALGAGAVALMVLGGARLATVRGRNR